MLTPESFKKTGELGASGRFEHNLRRRRRQTERIRYRRDRDASRLQSVLRVQRYRFVSFGSGRRVLRVRTAHLSQHEPVVTF